MKTKKFLKISLVCLPIISVILYGIIFSQSISVLEFQYAQFLLFAAEIILFLTVVFMIFLLLISKNTITLTKAKKPLASLVLFFAIVYVVLTGYSYITCYNLYTPENLLKNDKVYIQQFMPYHNILDDYREDTELSVTHIPGTDYVFLNCYGTSETGIPLNYEVEYFKSTSPFMNMKFNLERAFLSPLSEYDIDVAVPSKDMEIDGTKLTVFVDDNDYAVLIKSSNRSIYTSLTNATEEISVDDFARETIRQFELLNSAVKEKVFLDAPLF